EELRSRYGDGLRRYSERHRARGRDRLSELALRSPGAAAHRGEIAAVLKHLLRRPGQPRPFCFPPGGAKFRTSAALRWSQFREQDLSPHKGCYMSKKQLNRPKPCRILRS